MTINPLHEAFRNHDFRSIEDQLRKAYEQAFFLQQQQDELKVELDGKVDLISKSQSLNGVTTTSKLGSGVISSDGIVTDGKITLNGSGTFFTSEIAQVITNSVIGSGSVSSTGIMTNNEITITGIGTTFTTTVAPIGVVSNAVGTTCIVISGITYQVKEVKDNSNLTIFASINMVPFTGYGYAITKPVVINGLITDRGIRIGADSYPIHSIINDSRLVIQASANIPAFTNIFYTIIKPATAEQLIGDFEFGAVNGSLFHGRINQKSILLHYGRIADPFDVVNVQYVQNVTYPILVKALQAILRTGDKVGINQNTAAYYQYDYKNCNFLFDNSVKNKLVSGMYVPDPGVTGNKDEPGSNFIIKSYNIEFIDSNFNLGNATHSTDGRYYGPIVHPKNFVTKEYLDEFINQLPFRAGQYESETGDIIRWVRCGEFIRCTGTKVVVPLETSPTSYPNSCHGYVSLQPKRNNPANPQNLGIKFLQVITNSVMYSEHMWSAGPTGTDVKEMSGTVFPAIKRQVDASLVPVTRFAFADVLHVPNDPMPPGSPGGLKIYMGLFKGQQISTNWYLDGIGAIQAYDANESWTPCDTHCFKDCPQDCPGHCTNYCQYDSHICGAGDSCGVAENGCHSVDNHCGECGNDTT